MTYRSSFWLTLVPLLLSACSPNVPEPQSPGARLYVARCNGCHRVYGPGTLKFAMWEMQVERMQGEMVRRGLPALTSAEKEMLLAYLKRHSDGARATTE